MTKADVAVMAQGVTHHSSYVIVVEDWPPTPRTVD